MQARNTLAQGHGLNRMTAAAAGIALLAASALGVAALNDQVELPLIGGSSEIKISTNRVAEIAFSEQNVWEYQGATAQRTVKSIRFAEDNSFDYAVPVTAEQVQFIEENVWEYASSAYLAGDAEAPDEAANHRYHRFLEENTDRESSALPMGDSGLTDY